MTPSRFIMCFFILSLFPGSFSLAEENKASLPLSVWEKMLSELESFKLPDPTPIPVCSLERSIDGAFKKGLFQGSLTARFEVLDITGHVRVPILDARASLGEVLLNGKSTSLLKEGSMYTLGVDNPGRYQIQLRFFFGQEQEDFEPKLQFLIPDSGSTRISVVIPQQGIEAKLNNGALVGQQKSPQGTILLGQLDASGVVDLSWKRRVTHKAKESVNMKARFHTLLVIEETVVTGLSVFDFSLSKGEIDRIELRVPKDVTISKVEGEAVLQPFRESDEKEVVLLRYLVEDQIRIAVHFTYLNNETKLDQDKIPVELKLPLPSEDIQEMRGSIGIQGPAGLNITEESAQSAESLSPRDMPQELTDLTTNPLLFGYRFTQPPKIRLSVTRHGELELTSTLIDELQASTVVNEDGVEITKMKLRIRNNTLQYLTMNLPEGALLTHSLIDGQPTRPAKKTLESGKEVLLFPLRQSERIGSGKERIHVVREGDTLSSISNLYFSDPSKWKSILDNNQDQLSNETDVMTGQQIRIPAGAGVTMEESSFILELAYKLNRNPLGPWGQILLSLPATDVDCMKVVWHLYFPRELTPLRFDANLSQYSAIRYDPFRRIRDFLQKAFQNQSVWAGEKYESILKQRKGIWRAEKEIQSRSEVVLTEFPLTGERYRFKRVLMGRETPSISLQYLDEAFAGPLRWVILVAAFVMGLFLLSNKRNKRNLFWAAGALVVMLVLAHYILGMHRRILWGVDLALMVAILRLRFKTLWNGFIQFMKSPWIAVQWININNLALVVGFCLLCWIILWVPLLLSSVTAVVLFFWWLRKTKQSKMPSPAKDAEVSHV